MLRIVIDSPEYAGKDVVLEEEPMSMFIAKSLSKQLVGKKIIIYHGQKVRRSYFNGYVVE